MRSLKARTTGDYLSAATENCRAADRGINLPDARRSCARYLAQVHDVRGALDALAMTPAETPAERNFHAFIRMLIATSERDPTEAAAIEAYARGFVARGGGRQRRVPTLIWPNLAIAHARAGRIPEAQALVARTPGCYDCLVARAVVARFARDWPSSERWFTQATRRGPRVPFAYYAWGEARLARGDVEGALRMLREARERGPGWAEPLKLEGDILLRRGEARAALGKFEAAAERAPRWGALHLAWGRTLEESGRDEEARAKYAEAARLHLSAADRAAVQRLLARPTA
jgi:tetratricopeptide (TPR) repeat protein